MQRLLERIQNWLLGIYQTLYNWYTNLLNIFSNNEQYFIDSKDYSDPLSVQELLKQSPHLNEGITLKELTHKLTKIQNIDDALRRFGLKDAEVTLKKLSESFVGLFKEYNKKCTKVQLSRPLYVQFKLLLIDLIEAALICCEHYNWSIKNTLLDPLQPLTREASNSEQEKEADKSMRAESNCSYTFNLFSKEAKDNNVSNAPTTLSLRYGSIMDIDE